MEKEKINIILDIAKISNNEAVVEVLEQLLAVTVLVHGDAISKRISTEEQLRKEKEYIQTLSQLIVEYKFKYMSDPLNVTQQEVAKQEDKKE